MDEKPICVMCRLRFPFTKYNKKYCSSRCRWKAQKPDLEKRREISKRYYRRHKKKALAASARWEKANRGKVNALHRAYYERHRDRILTRQKTPLLRAKANERKKKWRKLNPDKVRIMNARQHNRIKFAGLRDSILKRDEHTCQDCLARNIQLSVHHIDGSGQQDNINNRPENLIALCRSCHRKRHLNQN